MVVIHLPVSATIATQALIALGYYLTSPQTLTGYSHMDKLQWGNRKRLRCMKVKESVSNGKSEGGMSAVKRKMTSRFVYNSKEANGVSSPSRVNRDVGMNRSNGNENKKVTTSVGVDEHSSIKVDHQFISKLKNQAPWRNQYYPLGQAEDEAKEMDNSNASGNEFLAVVTWLPSQFFTDVSSQIDTAVMMDGKELDGETMEFDDNGIAAEQRSIDAAAIMAGNEEGLQQWQRQHCMIPHPPLPTLSSKEKEEAFMAMKECKLS